MVEWAVYSCSNSVRAVLGRPGAGRHLVGLELAHQRPLVGGEVRRQDSVVPVGEQGGVVVGDGAVHDQHDRLGDVLGGDATDQAVAEQGAHVGVVEAVVVGPAAAEGEAVVVDDLDAMGSGVGLDLGPDAGVQRVHDQDLVALGDVGLGIRELGGVAAVGVDDRDVRGGQAGVLQGRWSGTERRTRRSGWTRRCQAGWRRCHLCLWR